MSTEPTLSIKLADYDALRDQVKNADHRVAEVRKEVDALTQQLAAAKVADPSNVIQGYRSIIDDLVMVLQFAVANLDPMTVRGWPYPSLRAVATKVETLPGLAPYNVELPIPLREFSYSAEYYEEVRKARTQHAVPAGPSDFGPQTSEAALAHATRTQATKIDR